MRAWRHGLLLGALAGAATVFAPAATAAPATASAGTASAAGSVHVTYVAGARWGSGAEYFTELAGVSLTGAIRFTAVRSTIRIRIDDKGALDGQTVAVLGLHGREWTCVPVRKTVTLGGFTPGEHVSANIEGDQVWTASGCTAHAVGGVVDVAL
jgi:hypothetical protein